MVLKGPWSYSSATACARALYMRKVVKAPIEPRPERFIDIDRRALGSVLHEGAEVILTKILAKEAYDCQQIADGVLNSVEDGKRIYGHLAPEVLDITNNLQKFADRFRVDDGDTVERDVFVRDHILGHEMELAIDGRGQACNFDKCPEDGWRGIVDYADADGDLLTVIDFKNRPALFRETELRDDEQLAGYLHLVASQYPQYKHYRVGIYYFEYGLLQLIDLEPERMHNSVARLKARARAKEQLAQEQIGPEPGYGKCQYCDWLASCPEGKQFSAGSEIMVMDAEQARAQASWLLVVKERVKAVNAALQAYTSEFGPVNLDDRTCLGYSVSLEGVKYDKDKTLRILKKAIDDKRLKGHKLADFTSLVLDDVKKAARDPVIFEALAPARSPKIEPKFEFFRPTAAEGVKVEKQGRKTVAKVKKGE
jgi:hypothetical protein